MITANFISPKGAWQAKPADTIVLDFDERHRRRTAMKGTNGLEFLLDLPEAVMLRGGDALVLEDGRLVEVIAAPEALAEIRVGEPRDLARLAWHLGNRHLPVQILANRIRIRGDAVIEDMARGLGAKIAHIEAPFDPEGGEMFIREGSRSIESLGLIDEVRHKIYTANAMRLLKISAD